jgi:hypothetical protein
MSHVGARARDAYPKTKDCDAENGALRPERQGTRDRIARTPLVEMPHEFPDVRFAEFPARFQVGRVTQNRQHFFGQTPVSFLA